MVSFASVSNQFLVHCSDLSFPLLALNIHAIISNIDMEKLSVMTVRYA